MSSNVVIRPVRPADMRDITKIYSQAVEHGTASFEIEPPSEAEMSTRRKMLLDGGFPYLVADAGGVVAGYAYAGPYRPRIAYRYTVEDSVYVHPRAARHGLGRKLLAELIAEAQARGFRQMVAVIGDCNCRRSSCTRRWAFRKSARSQISATSTAAGSTAC